MQIYMTYIPFRSSSLCLCVSVTFDLLTGGHCLSGTGVCPSVKHITAQILSGNLYCLQPPLMDNKSGIQSESHSIN